MEGGPPLSLEAHTALGSILSLSLSLSLSCEGIVSSAIANQHSGECAFVTVRVTKVLDDGAVEFCVHRGQEFSYWVYRS